MILSGGGDDFVDFLPSLLNEYKPTGPALNESEVNDLPCKRPGYPDARGHRTAEYCPEPVGRARRYVETR